MKKLNGVSDSIFFVLWCGFLIYMASTEAVQGNWFFAAWCTFILSLGVSSLIRGAVRARQAKQFGIVHSLNYLDDLLPGGLILNSTSFDYQRCSTVNCLHGSLRGIRLAVFDLRYRRGKSSASQTVVAFPREGSNGIPEPPIDAVGSYQFEAAGDWIIAWIPGRTVNVEELEDWCIELHTLARDLLAPKPEARLNSARAYFAG